MHPKHRTIELRDIDGAYVAGMPIDQDRLRVVLSNIAPVGAFLAKPREVLWHVGVQDLGGYTLLSPYDLTDPAADQMGDPLVRDFVRALQSDDEIVLQAHDRVEHRSGNRVESPDELVSVEDN